jgi:hypothetical protein
VDFVFSTTLQASLISYVHLRSVSPAPCLRPFQGGQDVFREQIVLANMYCDTGETSRSSKVLNASSSPSFLDAKDKCKLSDPVAICSKAFMRLPLQSQAFLTHNP